MDYKKIGEFIQNRRKELGLTQKQLGIKLNVTDKAVSKWENGLGCPDVSILGELSDALGVGIGEILNGEYNDELKDNSEFIKNAVDYSKKITEDSIYSKIRKVLYLILICIVSYISVMGIKQFVYLCGGVEIETTINDIQHKEYYKLKQNIKIVKEKGYLRDFNFDYTESLYKIMNRLEKTNLLNEGKIVIKNTELYNIDQLVYNLDEVGRVFLHELEVLDKENKKYYDLIYINLIREPDFPIRVDEKGILEGYDSFDYDSSVYYSNKIYYYNHLDNKVLLNDYYYEMGVEFSKLNKILELIIEVGEENEI